MKQLQMFSSPVLSVRDFVRMRLRDLPFRQRAREERRARHRRTKARKLLGGDLARRVCYSC
jgi:hypothetical protein